MELKEFDLSKVVSLAQQNQSNNQTNKPITQKQDNKANTVKSVDSFNLSNILNRVKDIKPNNTVDSKTSEMMRQSVGNYTLNKIQSQIGNFTPESADNVVYDVKVFLDFVKDGEELTEIENGCKKYYDGYHNNLVRKYTNVTNKEKDLQNSSIAKEYKDSVDTINFYENNKNEWKNETTNAKLIGLLDSISKSTATNTINALLDNFSSNSSSALDILNSEPSTDDINTFINTLPDTDDEDESYNKADFLKNLSPETKNYFIKRDKLIGDTNPVDKSILNSIILYKNARNFIENDKEYAKYKNEIEKCKNIKNNLNIENRNLSQNFLEIEKMLSRKKKQFRLPDTSTVIIPRKSK